MHPTAGGRLIRYGATYRYVVRSTYRTRETLYRYEYSYGPSTFHIWTNCTAGREKVRTVPFHDGQHRALAVGDVGLALLENTHATGRAGLRVAAAELSGQAGRRPIS
eukprot:scaffold227129_cov18-Prasinocladus_malaysianus.AAC.1